MLNTVVHVTLPKGFALTNGATLVDDTDFMVLGTISPWYSSVDQVRLEGGIYLRKLSDLTIAAQIWQTSLDADVIAAVPPAPPAPGTAPSDYGYRVWNNFVHGRNQWVSQRAALDIITKAFDLSGVRGSKTLGNFSVMRMAFGRGEGIPHLMSEMQKELDKWKIVLQSGGTIAFGGHVRANMAAKGYYSRSDKVPGRLWANTGMGAAHTSHAGHGSEGKPVKYGSPTFIDYRVGRQFGNYITMYPTVVWS